LLNNDTMSSSAGKLFEEYDTSSTLLLKRANKRSNASVAPFLEENGVG
jgi:hypothetical protein